MTWDQFKKSKDYDQLKRYKEAAKEHNAQVEYYFPDGASSDIINNLSKEGINVKVKE